MDYFLFNVVRLLETSSCSPRPGVPQCLSKQVTRLCVFLSSGNRSLDCCSVAPKNRMLVANPTVCPGRRTKTINSFLDRGTIVLMKIASVRNSTYKLIRRSLVKCGRQRVAVGARCSSWQIQKCEVGSFLLPGQNPTSFSQPSVIARRSCPVYW
jgi:hypothetical protein